MKTFLVLAALSLGLAGCGSMDFWGESNSAEDQPAPSRVVVESPPPPPSVTAAPLPPPPAENAPAPVVSAVAEPPAAMPEAPVAVVETTKLPPNAHCMALAKQRAIDAAYQGEDGDTQEAVHERTYAECVAWDLKHAYSR